MDVAVAFSSIQPSPSEGLMSSNVFYEGFHILASPFEVLVADTSHICDTRPLPPCKGAEFGTAPGEWVLHAPNSSLLPEKTDIAFKKATHFWQPYSCHLPSMSCLRKAFQQQRLSGCSSPVKQLGLALVGDSLTNRQFEHLTAITAGLSMIAVIYQTTRDGMYFSMPGIKSTIDELLQCQTARSCIPALQFNSGLYDIERFCSDLGLTLRKEIGFDEASHNCVAHCQELLQEVIDYTKDLRGPKIWRSTTASWQKWGNYQIGWSYIPVKQPFTSSNFVIPAFNDIAIKLFRAAGWFVIDGYLPTESRSDHMERTDGPGAHVHFAQKVVHLQNVQLLTAVLQSACPAAFNTSLQCQAYTELLT